MFKKLDLILHIFIGTFVMGSIVSGAFIMVAFSRGIVFSNMPFLWIISISYGVSFLITWSLVNFIWPNTSKSKGSKLGVGTKRVPATDLSIGDRVIPITKGIERALVLANTNDPRVAHFHVPGNPRNIVKSVPWSEVSSTMEKIVPDFD